MTAVQTRVIKLGGSLLDRPDLSESFTRWRRRQAAMVDIVITGGGQLADRIRDIQSTHALQETTSHWLAVRCMSVTAQLATELLAGSQLIHGLKEIRRTANGNSLWVLDPLRFLLDIEPHQPGESLPQSWDVTSDSIAARVAEVSGAVELVLLKSSLPDDCTDWIAAAQAGFVDRHFPVAVKRVRRSQCVNLASGAAPSWQPTTS